MSYTTTINSKFSFIDPSINGTWTTINPNSEGVYIYNENGINVSLSNNIDGTFTLMKEGKSITVDELPSNLIVNAMPNTGASGFVFQLEQYAPGTGNNKPELLSFDPKYFTYNSVNNNYTLDVDHIIADHDIAAVTGIIDVSMQKQTGTSEDDAMFITNVSNRKAVITYNISAIAKEVRDQVNEGMINTITSSSTYIEVSEEIKGAVSISFSNAAADKIEGAWQKSDGSGANDLSFTPMKVNEILTEIDGATHVKINASSIEYKIPLTDTTYSAGKNLELNDTTFNISGVNSGVLYSEQTSNNGATLIGVAKNSSAVGLPDVVNVGKFGQDNPKFKINSNANAIIDTDVKDGDTILEVLSGDLHIKIGDKIIMTFTAQTGVN